jgi:hypothetical protein
VFTRTPNRTLCEDNQTRIHAAQVPTVDFVTSHVSLYHSMTYTAPFVLVHSAEGAEPNGPTYVPKGSRTDQLHSRLCVQMYVPM